MTSKKICVIGAGPWGKNHIKTLHALHALGGIIETNPRVASELQTTYPNCPIFPSYTPDIANQMDGFIVAAPAEYHFDIAQKLLLDGKPVLVEKPITLSVASAQALVDLAKKQNVPLLTGHLMLFHGAIRKIKELIQTGKLGKIQYIYSNRLNLGTVRKTENSLWSFAPHDISILEYLLEAEPSSIQANGGAYVQSHIHDTTLTVLGYPGNVMCHIFVSWLHPFKEHRLVVIGDKGMVSYDDSSTDKSLHFYEKGIDWIGGEPVKRDGNTHVIPYETTPPLESELRHFMDCISTNTPSPLIGGEKGVKVLRVLEEAQRLLELSLTKPEKTPACEPEKKDYFAHETVQIENGASIGEDTRIWNHSHVQKNAVIGKGCRIGQNVNIAPNVKVGNFVKIQNNVSVYEGVELEDYVFCGPSMVFTNIIVPRSKYPQADAKFYQKTLVKEGASLGANSTIVCGSTLGKHCLVGAGAVVTKDVPDYAIVVGNPARIVGWISEGGCKLDFSQNDRVYCEKSNRWYQFVNQHVIEVTQQPVTN